MQRQKGFTLIEVMVVVVVIAILASIAIPSYREYVIRGHRRAAQAAMMEIATQQQQYFVANRAYAALGDLGYALPPEVDEYYNLVGADGVTAGIELLAGPPPGFIIRLAPQGSQAGDGLLTLTSAGVKTPAAKW